MRNKWIGVIVGGFIVAVLFGAQGPLGGFWGVEESSSDPSGLALAGLVTAALVEAVAFGVGLAWIAFGWRVVQHVNRPLAVATYVAVAWALVSWVPHTAFHQSLAEENWSGLAAIEWGFHVTLVFGAFVAAAFVWQTFKEIPTTQIHTSRQTASV